MYHAVGSRGLGDEDAIFGITPKQFEAHMDLVAAQFVDCVVPLDMEHVGGSRQKLVISFDDGYKDNLLSAAPILLERGFPFTVFISTGLVQKHSDLFLSPAEIVELSNLPGVSIGAHGVNHVPLALCNDESLQYELLASKRFLEDLLSRPITKLAYPYGSVNRRVRDAAHEAGYTLAVCSHTDVNLEGRDPLLLARTSMSGLDSDRAVTQKLRGDWDWYRWRHKDPQAG
jgi:peptidoglycan/xylan/chitin deacetylase (PgdA/CDA1 family)